MTVVIVGGGIGGLTAALSLHAVGVPVRVLEATAQLRPLGVGINLLPHATAHLTELGLGKALADTAIATSEVVHLDRFGNEIWRDPRGRAAGHNHPQYSVHRGDLQQILLDAVRERIGPGTPSLGMRVLDTRNETHRAVCRVHNRRTDTIEEISGTAVIGADGIASAIRRTLYPHEGEPLWGGVRMWRGTAAARPFRTGSSMVIAGSNHAAKFVMYPVRPRAGGDGKSLINWVAEVRTDRPGAAPEWNRTGRLADVAPHFTGWHPAGVDICGLMAATQHILEYPMVDRDPLPRWSFGRITLLGDAAHPMYPVGSNGGSQAILDARALAESFATAPNTGEPASIDVPSVLADYQSRRLDSANAVAAANRDIPMDRVLRLVAERAPHGFDTITDVLTAAEIDALGGSYRHTSQG